MKVKKKYLTKENIFLEGRSLLFFTILLDLQRPILKVHEVRPFTNSPSFKKSAERNRQSHAEQPEAQKIPTFVNSMLQLTLQNRGQKVLSMRFPQQTIPIRLTLLAD